MPDLSDRPLRRGSLIHPCVTILDEALLLGPKKVLFLGHTGVPYVELGKYQPVVPITSWVRVR